MITVDAIARQLTVRCDCGGERARLGNFLDLEEIVHRRMPVLSARAISLLQTGHRPDCPGRP